MTYSKRSYTNMSELESHISSGRNNKEQETMFKQRSKIIQHLKENRIEEFPDFCSLLKKSGASRDKMKDIIMDMVINQHINKDTIKTRLINKSSCSDKNLIFTWICLFYPNEFIQHINYLLTAKIIIPENGFNLKSGIEAKIDQIQKQRENVTSILEKYTINESIDISNNEIDQSNDEFDLILNTDFDNFDEYNYFL